MMCYDACVQTAMFPGLLLGHEFEDGECDEARGPTDPLRDFIPIGDVSEGVLDADYVEMIGLGETAQERDERILADDGDDADGDTDPLVQLLAEEDHDEFEFSEGRGDAGYADFDPIDDADDFMILMASFAGDENLRVAYVYPAIDPICRDAQSRNERTRAKESNARKPRKFNKRTTIRGSEVREYWEYDPFVRKEYLRDAEIIPRTLR